MIHCVYESDFMQQTQSSLRSGNEGRYPAYGADRKRDRSLCSIERRVMLWPFCGRNCGLGVVILRIGFHPHTVRSK